MFNVREILIYFIKQIKCIYKAQNHNQIATVGFTICIKRHPLSSDPRFK